MSWVTVGVVMFDFVEYKAVPGRSHIPENALFLYNFDHQTCKITNMSFIVLRHSANRHRPCWSSKRRLWGSFQSAQQVSRCIRDIEECMHSSCHRVEAISVTTNSNFWPSRMCTWSKWPHVCCHLRRWGNIGSKRWSCSIFFWWGRYENNQEKVKLLTFLDDLWCNHDSDDPTGNFYLDYVDPVVVGRRAFHSTNDFICGVMGSIRDTLCAIVDTVLDTILDINKGKSSIF